MINFKSTRDQVFLVLSLLWLLNTLNDYISGSGANEEVEARIKEIKEWLKSKGATQ